MVECGDNAGVVEKGCGVLVNLISPLSDPKVLVHSGLSLSLSLSLSHFHLPSLSLSVSLSLPLTIPT